MSAGSTTQASRAYAAALTLMLYGMVRGSEALAGDLLFNEDHALKPDAASAPGAHESLRAPFSPHAPLSLSLDRHDESRSYSATEFRPRAGAQTDPDASAKAGIIADRPSFEGSVLQRMAEYKSQDRLRLLTLWRTSGSTLSLQANKHGGPSLQWSSPWMMRDGASSGLFDRWLAGPLRSISNGSRNPSVLHPAPEPAKQSNLSSAGSAP